MTDQGRRERVIEDSGAVAEGDVSLHAERDAAGRDVVHTTNNYYGDDASPRVQARWTTRTRGPEIADLANRRAAVVNPPEIASAKQITDLEVEISAGTSKGRRLFGPRRRLRRKGSLLNELRSSDEPLILVEGEAGSGKSVALKAVATQMNQAVTEDGGVVALYVNLKTLVRGTQPINDALIEAHVRRTVEGENEKIKSLIGAEFDRRRAEKGWLFLLDSFDEIPDVLAATEVDSLIDTYSRAIEEFALSAQGCRVVVASRLFNAPDLDKWATFRVAPLTEDRRRLFIAGFGLPEPRQEALLRGLGKASLEMDNRSRNPLFLTLLCEHTNDDFRFPKTPHEVIDQAILRRLERVTNTLDERHPSFTVDQLSEVGARIAYAMTAARIGLEPRIDELERVLGENNIEVDERLNAALAALGTAELARNSRGTFSFLHRRFQEYFTTLHVLKEGVPADVNLLTDGQWRETAVTLGQLGKGDVTKLVADAHVMLAAAVASLPPLDAGDSLELIKSANQLPAVLGQSFDWPTRSLHVLGVLQSGFGDGPERLPAETRELVGRLLATAWHLGEDDDRRKVLEVAGTAADDVRFALLCAAFNTGSRWLSEVAYSQAARLGSLTPELAAEIRRMLVGMAGSGRVWRERVTVKAEVARVEDTSLDRTLRMLWWVPPVDALAHVAVVGWLLWAVLSDAWTMSALFTGAVAAILVTLSFRGWRGLATVAATMRRRPESKARNAGDVHVAPSGAALGFIARLYVVVGCVWLAATCLPGLVVPVVYLLTWPVAALVAAVRGEYVEPAVRPLAHLSVWHAIRSTLSWKGVGKALLLVLAVATIGGAAIWLFTLVPTTATTGFVTVAVAIAFAIATFVAGIMPLVLDWLWYVRWTGDPRAEITHVEFLTYCEQQRTFGGLIRVARMVREDQLRPRKPEREDPGELLGLSRIDPKEISAIVDEQRFEKALISDWLSTLPKRRLKNIATAGVDLRDELGPTLASVRSRRTPDVEA